MRLFLAYASPPEWRVELNRLQDRRLPLRWVPAANWHVTLAFLGEVAEERRMELEAGLQEIPSARLNLQGRGLALWHQSILVARLELSAELGGLHQSIRRLLADKGWPPEPKPYQPHITLARGSKPLADGLWQAYARDRSPLHLPSAEATQFHLYVSQLTKEGAHYRILRTFPAK